jgi:hypothetical protein
VKAPASFLPSPWKVPNIGGSPRVGLTLTAVPGTWVPEGAEVSYRWLIGANPIPGATGPTFVPTADQVGKKITLEVTADGQTKKNRDLASVYKGVFSASKPTLTGVVAVGQQVGVDVGGWAVPQATFSYVWKRNGKTIKKATSATYQPTASDLGKKLTVTVTARARGYVTKSLTSAAVKVGKALPAPTPTPTPSVTPTPPPSTPPPDPTPTAEPAPEPGPDPTDAP